jgi:signal peptidase I
MSSSPAPILKRRKPWLAFLLTQICPGLGQLYNGDLRWTWISIAVSLAVALGSEIFLFDSLNKLLFAVVLGLVIDTWLSIQAYLRARRVKEMELKRYQRWWVYIIFTVIIYGVPDGYGMLYPSRIRSFQIPSESMVPNLLVGDRLVADGWAYWHKDPQRGDIVVFDWPKDPSTKFVKRLIGLPGDKIELKKGQLFINNQPIQETLASSPALSGDSSNPTLYIEDLNGVRHTIQREQQVNDIPFGPVTVPADHYFMMGDNRDRSSDSRYWGFVARDALIGRMSYVYFSWDTEAYQKMRQADPANLMAAIKAGVRVDRIGKMVSDSLK